ncbi:MAG: hypothetical protein KBD37_01360 [Burkholderiales bacterium]|nr:hypothetical protein [Burkholderiales bacterium]
MFHACGILHHLSSNRHHSGVNKLLETINYLIAELREKKLDAAISALDKHVSEKKVNRYSMIRSIVLYTILSKSNDAEVCVDDYIRQAVSHFTEQEEIAILSAIDLSLVGFSPKTLYNITFWAVFRTLSITE